MAGNAGINFLLKVLDPVSGTYGTASGLQTKEYTVDGELIEITNHGSSEFKEYISGHGIRDFKVTGGGVHDGGHSLNLIEDACINTTNIGLQLVDTTSGGRTYTANFRVSNFKRSGSYKEDQKWSASFQSNGAFTIS